MAWEWSHSAEAYDNALGNLQMQDRSWLEVVFAEWHALESDENGEPILHSFSMDQYEAALTEAQELGDSELVEFIWDRMSEAATCDNGGHHAWACPDGCHTVPFNALKTH